MIVSSSLMSLPPQMIPLSKKTEKWKRDCMDSLESIGRDQFYRNLPLVENYQMIKGKFIYDHYIEREGYGDLISHLTQEFSLPSHLRHYDIISQVINTLSGEYQKRPDLFRVKAFGERAQNNFLREKTELILKYALNEINQYINVKLVEEGLDPERTDFGSQEEQQQYMEAVNQRTQELTPKEVEEYMSTSWMDAAEIWAENQLESDREKFSFAEKRKIEFEDMLTVSRCFRHFYIVPNGYEQETWNPIYVFFHKSPDVTYVEDGDYVGRVFHMSTAEIINRYGHKMTRKQLESLETLKLDTYKSNGNYNLGSRDWNGTIPGTFAPFDGYGDYNQIVSNLGFDPNNPETVRDEISVALGTNDTYSPYDRRSMFQVTEAYWMSQRKIGKYVYFDQELGEPATMIVDENFDAKALGVQEIHNSFMEFGEEEQVNTVTWTWVNQVWKGIKINDLTGNLKEPIYLDVRPNDFQFKGDSNIYGAKLPVCGQIFNNRNSEPMSLVDLMKPFQIGFNVAINQAYEIMQRELGRFAIIDFNFIPSGEDWGDKNLEKFAMVAKQLGIAPVDGSNANARQSNYPTVQHIDLDESARMLSRFKIAEAFEHFALKQVGITPQRLGDVSPSESATGVNQALSQSYSQTESYFTDFSNYEKRCLKMNLDIAQFVQSKNEVIETSFIKSDMSRAFISIAGIDILLNEFNVFVSDSRELVRKLETIRQLALENNTAGATMSDMFEIIESNSPAKIKAKLLETEKRAQEMQKREQDIQQQAIEAQNQREQMRMEFEAQENEKDRANERYVAEVRAMGFAKDTDINTNDIPDALEVQKFNAQLGKDSEDIVLKKQQERNRQTSDLRKAQLEERKMNLQKELSEKEAQEREKDRELKREELKSKEKIAKQNKNKYDSGSKKNK